MGSKNQTTKSVCLNHNNETDKKILRHVSRRNFSGYVKKLILADINSVLEKKQTKQEPKQEQKKPETHKKQVDNVPKKKASAQRVSVPSHNHGSVAFVNPLIKTQQTNR